MLKSFIKKVSLKHIYKKMQSNFDFDLPATMADIMMKVFIVVVVVVIFVVVVVGI